MDPKIRDAVVKLFDFRTEIQRKAMRRVLEGLNVCLIITGCRNYVRVQEFHEYNMHTYVLFMSLFPQLKDLNTTVHIFLGHSAQLIFLNGCKGFFHTREDPQEVRNKTVRNNRVNLSSTFNQGANHKFHSQLSIFKDNHPVTFCRFSLSIMR